MEKTGFKSILSYLLPLSGVALTVVICKGITPAVTSTTVALVFVLVVLFSATFGALGPGLLASAAAALSFNFFFLPPFGTFTIAHAQDVRLPDSAALHSASIDEMIDEYGRGVRYIVMRTPKGIVGVMALRAKNISQDTIEAVASLVVLTLERNRSIHDLASSI